MRPHHLQWAGIGPYPQRVDIDFDELSTLGLYLIVGPTGAGKTTIFDAITYALFGKLAGVRSAQQIISDHGDAAASEVTLDFSHRGCRYTVRRRPSPSGKNAKPNDHLLIAHATTGGQDREESRVTGATRVTDEVERILGLDASQFNRVMLLPQNEFQQFLLANSSDKEKLLRSLFDTDLFHRAEEDLENVARDLAETARVAAQKMEIAQSNIADLHIELITAGLLDAADPVGDPINIDLPALHTLVAEKLAQAAAHSRVVSEAAQKATQERSMADAEAQRYLAFIELTELHRVDADQAPILQLNTQLLRSHELALRIAAEIQRRDLAAQQVDQASTRREAARAAAERAITTSPWTHQLLTHLQAHISAGTSAKIATAFAGLRSHIEAATQRHAAAFEAERLSSQHRLRETQLLTQILATTEQHDRVLTELSAAKDAVNEAQIYALEVPSLLKAVQEITQLEAAADLIAPTAALAQAETHLATAQAVAVTAQSALDLGLSVRTQHLAGDLAQRLSTGDPCPVCGSVEHPSPAPISPDAPDIDALTFARDQKHQERASAELAVSRCQEALETAQLALAQLPPNEERAAARNRHEIAETSAQKISSLTALVDQLTESRISLHSQIEQDTSELTAAQQMAEQETTKAANYRSLAEIPEELLLSTATLLTTLDDTVNKIVEFTAQLDAARPVHMSATHRVAELLSGSEFVDEDAVLAAVLPDDRQIEIAKMMETAQSRATKIARLEGSVGDRPLPAQAPDLDALSTNEQELIRQAALAADAATRLEVANTKCAKIAKTLDRIGPEAALSQQRATRFREIANIARNGKRPHFPLERWVQRAIFEDVCTVASERIKVLSSGRYLLTLEAEQGRERAQAGGLDLYVTDSHTGHTRAVQTLSGGEQFLTSLALALALAEVVQQMSGGMELSSLFIDEGFGSLDGETLDTAIEVLRALQDSGRSVGVISHVEAMQHDLPVGIRVIPGPTGSRVTFPALNRN